MHRSCERISYSKALHMVVGIYIHFFNFYVQDCWGNFKHLRMLMKKFLYNLVSLPLFFPLFLLLWCQPFVFAEFNTIPYLKFLYDVMIYTVPHLLANKRIKIDQDSSLFNLTTSLFTALMIKQTKSTKQTYCASLPLSVCELWFFMHPFAFAKDLHTHI